MNPGGGMSKMEIGFPESTAPHLTHRIFPLWG